MTPQALTQVRALLGLEQHADLDEIASWADEIRNGRRETAPWHFVDIPLAATVYDASRDCARGDCVVARIPYYARVLADRRADPPARLDALKFLTHLVGDLHQPLHCADDHDRGGNDVAVLYLEERRETNLHRIWDDDILEYGLHLRSHRRRSDIVDALRVDAAQLAAEVKPADAALWAPAGMLDHLDDVVIAWANQSHQLARDVAYGDLPSPAQPHSAPEQLGPSYQQAAWLRIPTQGGHVFRFDGGRPTDLMAATIPI